MGHISSVPNLVLCMRMVYENFMHLHLRKEVWIKGKIVALFRLMVL